MTLLTRLATWSASTGCAGALGGTGPGDATGTAGNRPTLLLVGGDPVPVTSGDSVLNDLALQADAGIQVVAPEPDSGAGEIPREDGLTPEQVETFLAQGRALTDAHADSATPLLLVGLPDGQGTTATSTVALIGTLCNVEPVKLITATGGDDGAWEELTVSVRDAMFRARPLRRRPADPATARELLRILGSPEIAVTAGILAQSAARRTPVILDGSATLAAGLVADALHAGASRWWLAPHAPGPATASPALSRLRLDPVLGEDLGVPDGAAGLAVLPLVRTAAVLAGRNG
ncbi:MAG: nicotinate-nucleotide--dimethylbenzimidazole phosphoribosyltransferase [Mycobacteriaceae bacterium]|uniref:nicotinate-nucleotide--dimethylbenzimidazole phosphoribosyltransferase n=1 Tax=Corynebacterium sp. TaxID=1720 RepID=UPI003F94BC30